MRTGLLGALGTAAVLLAAGSAYAQPAGAPAAQRKPVVEEQTVRTKDGWTLPITYYAVPGKETPVVILLHGRDGDRGVWRGLAERIQAAKIAVVTVDLRKHGESTPPPNARAAKVTPADYQAMAVFDLPAVKEFLLGKHHDEQLNIRKTAVVAADDSAPVAATWAAGDWAAAPFPDAPTIEARTPRGQDVRAVVLLSPTEAAGRVNLGRALPALRTPAFQVAVLVGVGELDKDGLKTGEKTYERLVPAGATEEDKRVYLEVYPQVKASGVELLGATRNRAPEDILRFLDMHLKTLPDKWRNRKSRLG